MVSAGGLYLAPAARLGGEVTMSIKVPTYLKHGSHMGKKKLRDCCPQTGLCSGMSEDRAHEQITERSRHVVKRAWTSESDPVYVRLSFPVLRWSQ